MKHFLINTDMAGSWTGVKLITFTLIHSFQAAYIITVDHLWKLAANEGTLAENPTLRTKIHPQLFIACGKKFNNFLGQASTYV
jgi:hypothetical protein